MKLIAKCSLRNHNKLIPVAKAEHPMHVPKGTVFEIGEGDELAGIEDDRTRIHVGLLIVSGVVVPLTEEAESQINEEIAIEKNREANAAKRDAALADTATDFIAVLQRAMTPAKAK